MTKWKALGYCAAVLVLFNIVTGTSSVCGCFSITVHLADVMEVETMPDHDLPASLLTRMQALANRQLIGKTIEEIAAFCETSSASPEKEHTTRLGVSSPSFMCTVMHQGDKNNPFWSYENSRLLIGKYWLSDGIFWRNGLVIKISIAEDKKIVATKFENFRSMESGMGWFPEFSRNYIKNF